MTTAPTSNGTASPAKSHVLFDLDGTLIDSRVGIVGALRRALADVGIQPPPDYELATHIGPPLPLTLAKCGVANRDVPAVIDGYRRHFARIGARGARVFEGIVELLARLRSTGVVLGIATAKPTPIAIQVLEGQGLLSWFDSVCGADMDESNSRKDAVIRRALADTGAPDPASAVMVGDRRDDVLGARANDVDAVAVGWGFAAPGELDAAGARWSVATVTELDRLLLASSGA